MEELFSHLPNLLTFSFDCAPDDWIEETMKGLYYGSNYNILLQQLIIYDDHVLEEDIIYIIQYCPKLLLLCVSSNIEITEILLLAISKYCPLLKVKRIFY